MKETNNNIDHIEWKRGFPIKKLLSILIDILFTIGFIGIFIDKKSVTKGGVGMLLVYFVLLIALIIHIIWTINYLKSPYLSIPKVSRYISKSNLRNNIKKQVFVDLKPPKMPEKSLLESKEWIFLKGRFVSINMISHYTYHRSEGSFYHEFNLINGDTILITTNRIKELTTILDEKFNHGQEQSKLSSFHSKQLKDYYLRWLELGNDPMHLIESRETMMDYVKGCLSNLT